ncbi:BTAD domain-containing putative transcriptional regulator [Streptomyces sp. NPDC020801]|uniref:AfsR/SARP family transcriptional regulator n=1 Tax=unclassified Streptomyces TaxID=2593676 RepID=UPI00378C19EE
MQSNASHGDLSLKILGPLEGWEGERRLRLGGVVNERVLAMLLLEAGRVVPASRLIQAVWDQEPPLTALAQIRKAVADLRRRISSGRSLIVTEPCGYRAVVDEVQLDLRVFDAEVRQAQKAYKEGELHIAIAHLMTGLDLWRGSILAGVGGRVIEAVAAGWEERRIAATEHSFDLRLARGETGELIGELREAICAHPLRETLRGQLMLALYRSGRQAEAVEEYGRLRTLLSEDLGIDPGSRLAELHEAVLRGAPELEAPRRAEIRAPKPPLTATGTAPCTLPSDLVDFTGRQEEVNRLIAAVPTTEGRPGPRVLVIDGMGGSGKTALAVHVAHLLADDYPGGQLYLDLRGFTPGEEPLAAEAALGALLRALGVNGESVGDDPFSRVALWRDTTARRRLLLILDNVADSAQVRQLLPTFAGSLVIITSRARLPELEGSAGLSLGLLSDADSTELMSRILGGDRVATEPQAAADLVRLCGHLPLALRISGARLRKRPHWTLGYLVERLRDSSRILGELESGDRSVASVLRVSYEAMQPDRRDDFRLLSLYTGADFDVAAAAALLGTEPHRAEETLEHLLDVHLVQQCELGRYSFHDLVRWFARALPVVDPATETAAVLRLATHTRVAVERACDALFPGRVRYSSLPSACDDSTPQVPMDPERALQWFDREHGNVLAVIQLAHQHGLSRHVAWLGIGIGFYLHALNHFADFEAVARLAVDGARMDGDAELLCVSLVNLAVAQWRCELY